MRTIRAQRPWMAMAAGMVVALAACCGSRSGTATPDAEAAAFLGADAVAILAAPDRIESFRVARVIGKAPDPTKAIAGVERLAGGPLLDAAQTAQVRDLLFAEDSYEFDLAKACDPVPGVLLRAWQGGRYADLYLCFECLMWAVSVDTPIDRFPPIREWEDFDPVQRPLVALVKALFPADAAIQALR
ncbi:MAG: hypothetical protein FJ293_07875 [Planctomycetes bacterium]|nr:hypothetical protein [Planctomycetota bacterium]